MSEKNEVLQNIDEVNNRKLISKALNNELNFFEKLKFKKLLKTEKWQEYYQKIREMENRVDQLLFTDTTNRKINNQVLSKLGFPTEYKELVEKHYNGGSQKMGIDNIIDFIFGKPFILACAALAIVTGATMYWESMHWGNHLLVVTGIVATAYALASEA